MQPIDHHNYKLPPQKCGQCSVSAICLPFSLSTDEASELDKIIKTKMVLHAGEVLYQEHGAFSKLYAIRSGSFKCSTTKANGSEMVKGFYFPGEILGLDAISHQKHLTQAIALETSSVCEFDFSDLLQLSQAMPSLQRQLFKYMAKDIEKGLLLNRDGLAENKFAQFLLMVSLRLIKRGYCGTKIELSMSRQDIGSYLSMSPETISRLLEKLQKKGIIQYCKRSISLTDLEALRALAGHCD